MLGVELLRRARLAGYAGKSALYELIAAIRPRKRAQPLVRFEGLPGSSRSTTSARSTSSSATARPGGALLRLAPQVLALGASVAR